MEAKIKTKKLKNSELNRYSRHLVLPEIGIKGQEKIRKSKVLIVGIGGLGSPAALYLAAAGVGTIGIMDFDKIEENNLQRQIIHSTKDINTSKVESAKKAILSLNPSINVKTYDTKLGKKNAIEILKGYDVIIDATDNFPARYLVNDACVLLNKPNVYGSIFRFDGHVSVFNFKNAPCYRCLFPNPPPKDAAPNCADAGVLGVLPGVIGTIQATEALKIILGKGKTLAGRFLIYNALQMEFNELKAKKNKKCPLCSKNATIKELIDYEHFCGSKNSAVHQTEKKDEITVHELKAMIDSDKDFELIDVREKNEYGLFNIGKSKLIPLRDITKNNLHYLKNINKSKEIVVYCQSGARSAYALSLLKNKGYKNVKNLFGGIKAWIEHIEIENAL
ncbi:molybdopterin-synthase adenylyltransferase MoeB [Candidatus Woesearchaeota archaeon]|nr:molybdopterin-synthase adenylyltransferase MoeB [Candidatus Woesearchaeota archaeon]